MDTSEQYIKMCEKAEEIQELAPLEFGNWYVYLRPKEGKLWRWKTRQQFLDEKIKPCIDLIGEDYNGEPYHIFIDDIERCWIPRQDQLPLYRLCQGQRRLRLYPVSLSDRGLRE